MGMPDRNALSLVTLAWGVACFLVGRNPYSCINVFTITQAPDSKVRTTYLDLRIHATSYRDVVLDSPIIPPHSYRVITSKVCLCFDVFIMSRTYHECTTQ